MPEPSVAPPLPMPAEPSVDSEINQRVDAIVQSIRALHDDWESEPTRPRSQVQWNIYQQTLQLAEIYSEPSQSIGAAAIDSEPLLDLLGQAWYLDSIEQAATKFLSAGHPPEAFDYVVWPVQAIACDSSHPSAPTCNPQPPLAIGSQAVSWSAAESVGQRIRDLGQSPSNGRWLVLSRVERIDERGYFLRIEAVLPR